MTSVAVRRYEQFNYSIGQTSAQTDSIRPVARQFGVKTSYVRYYQQKYRDPSLHAGSHGGARNFKFTADTQAAALAALWDLNVVYPHKINAVYASEMIDLGFPVNSK